MAPCIISRPAFSGVISINAGVIGNLQKHIPDQGLRRSSYQHEFTTALGVEAVSLVTIFSSEAEAFVVLTDPDNAIGPGVSSNFAAVATELKALDPLLQTLPAENIHWIEYRGPGSYNGRTSPSFLLVIMNFNPVLKRFARASWGHIYRLADVVMSRQFISGGVPCHH